MLLASVQSGLRSSRSRSVTSAAPVPVSPFRMPATSRAATTPVIGMVISRSGPRPDSFSRPRVTLPTMRHLIVGDLTRNSSRSIFCDAMHSLPGLSIAHNWRGISRSSVRSSSARSAIRSISTCEAALGRVMASVARGGALEGVSGSLPHAASGTRQDAASATTTPCHAFTPVCPPMRQACFPNSG